MPLQITLGELLHQLAHEHMHRPAITMAESGETISYIQFERLVNRVAHGFQSLPHAGNGYVGIMHENAISYLAMAYALKKLNRVEVSINRAFRGAALTRMINLTECQLLMTSHQHLDALAEVVDDLPHLRALILTSGHNAAKRRFPNLKIIDFEQMQSSDESHITSTAHDTDLATIMFTSGTTGVSKGCRLSHRYAVRTAENMIKPFRLTAEDVNYTPYPLSHVGPAYYDILPSLMTGGRVVLRDHFSLTCFWPEVIRHEVTWFMCLGSVQQLLYAAPPSPLERQHRVTRAWATPAPVPKADFDRRFGLHLLPGGGYGSTDAGWVVTPQWDHNGGIVLPHYEVAIMDEHDNPLPAGKSGEMVIRPREAGIMADGYFGMPQETLKAQRNLWFHTGDIGWLDADGLFYFSCRMSERIRVKGEMVSTFEVEEGVLTLDGIEDAAAIGIAAAHGEEDVKLFVTLKPGYRLDAAAIDAHCRKVMAKFMVPVEIEICDSLPRTPTGKVEKARLAEAHSRHAAGHMPHPSP